MKCYLMALCLFLVPSVTLAQKDVPRTIVDSIFGEPGFTECDPMIAYSGGMQAGDVLIGTRVATDEPAVLIIFSSEILSRAVGLPPLEVELLQAVGVREEIRVIDGLLIGPVGAANVLALAVPTSISGDDWAFVVVPDLQFLPEISLASVQVRAESFQFQDGVGHHSSALLDDPPYDNPNPSDYCPDSFLCNEYGNVQCGPDPYDDCSPNAQHSGILECWRAAGCRLAHCIWAVCITDRNCECDWYKDLCQQYYDNWGEYPPPGWAPGTPYLACGLDMPRNAACLVVYGAELIACVPASCFFGSGNSHHE